MRFQGLSYLALSSLLLTIALAAPTQNQNQKHRETNPICIIGGGAAGLTTASLLHEKGYRTVVFEKQPKVGGKCRTLQVGGHKIDMGALLLDNSYTHVLALIKKFGMHTATVLDGKGAVTAYDYNTGALVNLPYFNETTATPEIRAAIAKFKAELKKYPEMDNGSAGHRLRRPELYVPFAKWLVDRGMGALLELFVVPIEHEGYGSLSETPAMYVLNFLNTKTAGSLVFSETNVDTIVEGWNALKENMARALPDVRTGMHIVGIRRPAGDDHHGHQVSVVYYDVHNYKHIQKCQSVVIAFPQLLERLEFLGLDARERNLFRNVQHTTYFSAAFSAPGLPIKNGEELLQLVNGNKTQVNSIGEGEPMSILAQSPEVYTSYAWFRDQRVEQNNHKLSKIVEKKLIGFVDRATKGKIKAKVIEVDQWDYFPHVGTKALLNGFYQKAEKIQGYRRTYYTGSLFGFETVERTMDAAHDLVKNHF
ncbi:hypothetical protein BC938DRAFT_484318 [Jimgerdemannia flammicorona]|uniref:Amine oxidase domain-containing protein n=1 Tax=Jimgerdemannia flammicorona TaxID=994334 RepID=A0A433QA32_9FUNG|nr:hypothetical protein BC938DRAFT_484318 [Jimgerdemannia flammicorona]